MRWLEEHGYGLDVGVAKVPIVPAAILFDLPLGRSNVRPDAAAGYAACFSNAVLHVAKIGKVDITEAPVSAVVGIGANDAGGFALAVALEVSLDLPQEAAEALVRHAHQVCPYSNATRNNIDVKLSVNGVALG